MAKQDDKVTEHLKEVLSKLNQVNSNLNNVMENIHRMTTPTMVVNSDGEIEYILIPTNVISNGIH